MITRVVQITLLLSAGLFLYYGLSCLFAGAMAEEFERYGIPQYRRLTGALEVLGAVGLLASYVVPALLYPASAGLSLLMVLGVITRYRARDPWIDAVPAVVLMLVNLFLLVAAIFGVPARR